MSNHLYLLRTKVLLKQNHAAPFKAHMYSLLKLTRRGSASIKQDLGTPS